MFFRNVGTSQPRIPPSKCWFPFYGEWLFPHRPTSKLQDPLLSAVATAYLTYLQLPYISEGRLRPPPEDVPNLGDKGPTSHGLRSYIIIIIIIVIIIIITISSLALQLLSGT
jgi:hypothetical protein